MKNKKNNIFEKSKVHLKENLILYLNSKKNKKIIFKKISIL